MSQDPIPTDGENITAALYEIAEAIREHRNAKCSESAPQIRVKLEPVAWLVHHPDGNTQLVSFSWAYSELPRTPLYEPEDA